MFHDFSPSIIEPGHDIEGNSGGQLYCCYTCIVNGDYPAIIQLTMKSDAHRDSIPEQVRLINNETRVRTYTIKRKKWYSNKYKK